MYCTFTSPCMGLLSFVSIYCVAYHWFVLYVHALEVQCSVLVLLMLSTLRLITQDLDMWTIFRDWGSWDSLLMICKAQENWTIFRTYYDLRLSPRVLSAVQYSTVLGKLWVRSELSYYITIRFQVLLSGEGMVCVLEYNSLTFFLYVSGVLCNRSLWCSSAILGQYLHPETLSLPEHFSLTSCPLHLWIIVFLSTVVIQYTIGNRLGGGCRYSGWKWSNEWSMEKALLLFNE